METMMTVGFGFKGTRKDGREFQGVVVKMAKTVKGDLVVLQDGEVYKSIYLQEMTSWSASLVNGQPMIV